MAIIKLINMRYANKDLMTGFGKLSFNESGEVQVEQEIADALKELKGFSVEETTDTENSDEEDENSFTDEEDTAEPIETADMGESGQQEDEITESTEDNSEEESTEDSDSEYTYEELDALNVAQLKKIATDAGIDIKNLTKKAQLISAIME